MVIDGEVEVNGQILNKRDAIEVTDANEFEIKINSTANLLAVEVPMLK